MEILHGYNNTGTSYDGGENNWLEITGNLLLRNLLNTALSFE